MEEHKTKPDEQGSASHPLRTVTAAAGGAAAGAVWSDAEPSLREHWSIPMGRRHGRPHRARVSATPT